MKILILNLLLAHLIGDFILQTAKSCERKSTQGLRGKDLYIHAGVIFLLSWLSSWNLSFWWAALLLATLHLFIDSLKVLINNGIDKRNEVFPFVADQVLHLLVIVGISFLWIKVFGCKEIGLLSSIYFKQLILLILVILCGRPSNLFIKLILGYCKVSIGENQTQSSFKSGALIGNLERWLILLFVILNQYEAIGFLVAAKSILRFNEVKDGEKSEYVLAGTLLSITIAVLCGIVFVNIK